MSAPSQHLVAEVITEEEHFCEKSSMLFVCAFFSLRGEREGPGANVDGLMNRCRDLDAIVRASIASCWTI